MKGKELLLNTIKLNKVDRTPWVPFVGVHGAKLINKNATEYLKSSELIVAGVSKAIELYNPDGIPVAFDLQIEAEALGCQLAWADENPPAVISHPLADGILLNELRIPGAKTARIPVVLEAAKKLRNKYKDIALYGLITGPFTLALHLLGTDIFMKMLEEPDLIINILEFTKKVSEAMAGYYIDAGCDIIAVVDPMTSQIDPDSFKMFITAPATQLFNYIRENGALGSFFVCGHAQQNIEVMCNCKPDNISIDENIPLDYVKDIALKNKISFGGNLQLTVVLLMGSTEDVKRNTIECLDTGGKKGFILAPGCDLPMMTPVENLKAVTELVNDSYLQEVERAKEQSEAQLELLNMKEYGSSDKVIVDIITLDSESCAPCQYMVEAVKIIAPHFEGIVEWREHPIKELKSITFMNSLMVKNIPTICIDGKITFVSQIPPKQDLINAIQKRINEKLKLKIKSRHAEILIIAKNTDECEEIKEKINIAMLETGKDIPVNISTDENTRMSFNINTTPAIIITQNKIKAEGDIPHIDVLKEWIKEL